MLKKKASNSSKKEKHGYYAQKYEENRIQHASLTKFNITGNNHRKRTHIRPKHIDFIDDGNILPCLTSIFYSYIYKYILVHTTAHYCQSINLQNQRGNVGFHPISP